MKPRDFAIVAALVLVAVIAAADVLRGGLDGGSEPGPVRTAAASGAGSRAVYPRVREEGSLVFTDARDCRVREIVLASGTEYRLPRITGDCRLWVPPFGARIAYSLGMGIGGVTLLRFFDLNHPERNFREHYAREGGVAWSLDGQRAAWCTDLGVGIDFEFYGEERPLDGCPSAYTLAGELAYVRGNRVVAGGKAVVRTRGRIQFVSFGYDGSVAVVAWPRLERHVDGGVRHATELPPFVRGSTPVLSADNCAALFPTGDEIHLIDVGCFRGKAGGFSGRDADWSPDGDWVVVAEPDAITFRRVVGEPEEVRWPTVASELGWRTRVPPRTTSSHG